MRSSACSSRSPKGPTRRPPGASWSSRGSGTETGGGRHDDGVVGGLGGPSPRPVAQEDHHVRDAERIERRARPARETGNPLDGDHALGEPGEDRRLVGRAGSDLEHRLVAPQRQGLGHRGHHLGRGDRLPLSDRKGALVVGPVPEGLGDQAVPRHAAQRGQNPGIPDSPRFWRRSTIRRREPSWPPPDEALRWPTSHPPYRRLERNPLNSQGSTLPLRSRLGGPDPASARAP